MRVCFTKMGVMIKLIDRRNTTPIGQGRASQWRNVLFDPYLFARKQLDLNHVVPEQSKEDYPDTSSLRNISSIT